MYTLYKVAHKSETVFNVTLTALVEANGF